MRAEREAQVIDLAKHIKALKKYYNDGYTVMTKRYPAAAKKKRIEKKWRSRFGPPLSEGIDLDGQILKSMTDLTPWSGCNIVRPLE